MTRLTRRRFLSLSAAAVATPVWAAPVRWSGHALGAEVSLTLRAPEATAQPAIDAALAQIRRVEAAFSLYDPNSELSRLNRTGWLTPSPMFNALLDHVDHVHDLTEGLFDPTVQAMYLAQHQSPATYRVAQRAVGWDRLQRGGGKVSLGQGQALTFNGIAQGYATDLVTQALEARGLTEILVNIGEYAARGGPWRLGIEDPTYGHLGTRTLTYGAIATSSPHVGANDAHIFHPRGGTRWSTISVEAESATLADGCSTGLCLGTEALVKRVAQTATVHRLTLVDQAGDLYTF